MSSSVGSAYRGMSRAVHARTGLIERTVIALSMASLRWARRREARFRLSREQHELRRTNELTIERERNSASMRRAQLP
jgi:hypothetical protein